MTDREIQERIEKYIQGEFSSEEEDKLWMEFLAEPD